MNDLQSKPYRPDAQQCCEACAFGAPRHARWCPVQRINDLVADGQKGIEKRAETTEDTGEYCQACLFGRTNHHEFCNAVEIAGHTVRPACEHRGQG
jgi:hypothetical protein